MLFNKNGKGSQEIYEITGTFPAATPYASIQGEIIDATKAVSDLIGSSLMEKAETAYKNDSASDADKQLIAAIQRPVACLAVQMFSRLQGVSHGEGGRKIKVDENEKIPFEWMIDRDDKAMRERYFRALDSLFAFLAQHEELWNMCSMKKPLASCIVKTLAQFETVYPIDGSHYTFFKILPLLLDAQDSLLSKTGMTVEEAAKNRKAVKYVVLSALATALLRWSIVIFPTSVARQFSPSYQGNRETAAASLKEIRFAADNFNQAAADELQSIRQSIKPDTTAGDLLPKNDPDNKFFTV